MTLILTDISSVGIAMAADSAVTYMNPDGTIHSIDHVGWKKLLWVPRIKAGVSYWGFVGKVTRRFDQWLEDRISNGIYIDLLTFADFIAQELNSRCGNHPLGVDECVGLHVAGLHPWADGVRRPTFYHVHNGHGVIQWQNMLQVAPVFAGGPPKFLPTNPRWVWHPRGPFVRHDDFPDPALPLHASLNTLKGPGHKTRNGDIGQYILIANALTDVCLALNAIPGVRIPSDPTRLGPRLGFLKMEIETASNVYKCSSLSRIIGGTVTTLGIRPDETRLR